MPIDFTSALKRGTSCLTELVIASAVLRGITDVRIPALITLVAYWIIALPLGYTLGIVGPFHAIGVWTGIAGGLAFAAVFLTVRFARLTRVR